MPAPSFPRAGRSRIEAVNSAPGSNAGVKRTPRPGPADREGLREESERQQGDCETWHAVKSKRAFHSPTLLTGPHRPRRSSAHGRCCCGTNFLHQRAPSRRETGAGPHRRPAPSGPLQVLSRGMSSEGQMDRIKRVIGCRFGNTGVLAKARCESNALKTQSFVAGTQIPPRLVGVSNMCSSQV